MNFGGCATSTEIAVGEVETNERILFVKKQWTVLSLLGRLQVFSTDVSKVANFVHNISKNAQLLF